jgi:hypothetical protein
MWPAYQAVHKFRTSSSGAYTPPLTPARQLACSSATRAALAMSLAPYDGHIGSCGGMNGKQYETRGKERCAMGMVSLVAIITISSMLPRCLFLLLQLQQNWLQCQRNAGLASGTAPSPCTELLTRPFLALLSVRC